MAAMTRDITMVQRPGVEPAQPVATVLQTAPLADGVSCMGGTWWIPLGSRQLESLNWWAERDSARTASCSLSVIQSLWVRLD